MKKSLYVFTILFSLPIVGYGNYEFTDKLQEAYARIFSLQFSEAQKIISAEESAHPDNKLGLLYLNYVDFLKTFISEDLATYEAFKKTSSRRFDLINSNKAASDSPYHLYIQSEILLQQALAAVKFEDYFVSARAIKKASSLIKENESRYPSFLLNKKVSGLLNVIIGSVPTRYQWIVKLAGLDGSINNGIQLITDLYKICPSSEYACYQPELLFYLGSVHSAYQLNDNTFEWLPELISYSGKSQLMAYVCSNILMKEGRNDEAIIIINNSLSVPNSFPVLFLYYKRGLARLRKLDFDASDDFRYYLNNYHGRNSIKAACQKLAWISLLAKDTVSYRKYLASARLSGASMLDDDKEAKHESESGEVVNAYLLKARLLFDGGYFQESLNELTSRNIEDFKHFHDQLEITYRIGRIMQKTGQLKKAKEYYLITLKNGSTSDYHFAANSALMLGLISENENRYREAGDYYKTCLALKYDRFKNSIDQKAKAGLERVRYKLHGDN